MIHALGLSPAWQQIYMVADLQPRGVHRASRAVNCASGKVTNVALAAKRLGGEAALHTIVGGQTAEIFRRAIEAEGLAARLLETQTPTRICTTVLDSATGTALELVENAGPLAPEMAERLIDGITDPAAAIAVITGSLPQGIEPGWCGRAAARFAGRVIADVRGEGLLALLPSRPLLVKPNREELEGTLGRSLGTGQELRAAMEELSQAGAEWVLVTDSERPALLFGPDGCWEFSFAPARGGNPIGCGDCLAAGIAVGLEEEAPMLEAVRLGFGAARCNLTTLVPADIDRRSAEQWASQVQCVQK